MFTIFNIIFFSLAVLIYTIFAVIYYVTYLIDINEHWFLNLVYTIIWPFHLLANMIFSFDID